MKAEIALSMLAAKAGMNPHARGGIPEWTPQDVAAACAGLSRLHHLLALRTWALDTSVDAELERYAYLRASDLATAGKWEIPKGREYVRKMVRLGIGEIVHPSTCRVCGGAGERLLNDKVTSCRRCAGTGRTTLSQADKAHHVGMDPAAWQRRWSRRYEEVYTMLREVEREAIRSIQKRLRQAG